MQTLADDHVLLKDEILRTSHVPWVSICLYDKSSLRLLSPHNPLWTTVEKSRKFDMNPSKMNFAHWPDCLTQPKASAL